MKTVNVNVKLLNVKTEMPKLRKVNLESFCIASGYSR